MKTMLLALTILASSAAAAHAEMGTITPVTPRSLCPQLVNTGWHFGPGGNVVFDYKVEWVECAPGITQKQRSQIIAKAGEMTSLIDQLQGSAAQAAPAAQQQPRQAQSNAIAPQPQKPPPFPIK